MSCGVDSVEKNKDGRLICVVCRNIGDPGAVVHLNYDGSYKRWPNGIKMYTYVNKNGTGYCTEDPWVSSDNIPMLPPYNTVLIRGILDLCKPYKPYKPYKPNDPEEPDDPDEPDEPEEPDDPDEPDEPDETDEIIIELD